MEPVPSCGCAAFSASMVNERTKASGSRAPEKTCSPLMKKSGTPGTDVFHVNTHLGVFFFFFQKGGEPVRSFFKSCFDWNHLCKPASHATKHWVHVQIAVVLIYAVYHTVPPPGQILPNITHCSDQGKKKYI